MISVLCCPIRIHPFIARSLWGESGGEQLSARSWQTLRAAPANTSPFPVLLLPLFAAFSVNRIAFIKTPARRKPTHWEYRRSRAGIHCVQQAALVQ